MGWNFFENAHEKQARLLKRTRPGSPQYMPLPRHAAKQHSSAMDITKFVADYREAAFLVGDYGTYRAQLSRRLRIVRKKLGRATAKNAKYTAKAPVTPEEVRSNVEYECSLCKCIFSC